jgi:hypothetical protein
MRHLVIGLSLAFINSIIAIVTCYSQNLTLHYFVISMICGILVAFQIIDVDADTKRLLLLALCLLILATPTAVFIEHKILGSQNGFKLLLRLMMTLMAFMAPIIIILIIFEVLVLRKNTKL